MVYPHDGTTRKPKHVTSYCKQKRICLPVPLCRLNEKIL